MDIFNFFGSILGYLLWFLYTIFNNYGVAIIFFSLIVKFALYPFTLKQQRGMSGQARVNEKQKEIRKMYANNNAKIQEEMNKLYEKEGVSPGSGCLTALIPLPIMFGIYYSVIYPLQNTLHIAQDKITAAAEYLSTVPGNIATTTNYVELEIINNWEHLKNNLTMFDAADVAKIESFADGFTFLGLDLLKSPQSAAFTEFLWVIPVFSAGSSIFMQVYMNKTSAMKQQGCMKVMMYSMSALSFYWAYIFPGAVGLYWAVSSLVGGLQSVITHTFFSATHLATEKEARRFVLLKENEVNYKPLPLHKQNELAEKIQQKEQKIEQNLSSNQSNSNKKKSGNKKSNNNYLGNKK